MEDRNVKKMSRVPFLEQFIFPKDILKDEHETPYIYQLFGIISHIGPSIDSGHYISYIKLKGEWYKCDDEDVYLSTKVSIEKLYGTMGASRTTEIGYILFYRRKEVEV